MKLNPYQQRACDFEFLISITIWSEILNVINLVSKLLQSKNKLIDVAMEKITGLIFFFRVIEKVV